MIYKIEILLNDFTFIYSEIYIPHKNKYKYFYYSSISNSLTFYDFKEKTYRTYTNIRRFAIYY